MLLLGEHDFAVTGHDSFDANGLVMVTLRQSTRMIRELRNLGYRVEPVGTAA
jgi:hypothetical protein